ncbi:MAG: mechanosensitive ion channel [Proteobacteria bacterium]|jgi:small-conductance mechanosensitive channel|nr:mechanosensitive ion channel [Pseudomonadota bacterium]
MPATRYRLAFRQPTAFYQSVTGLILLLALLILSPGVLAEELDTSALEKSLAGITKTLKNKHLNLDQLTDMSKEVANIKGRGTTCVDKLEPTVADGQEIIQSLGEPSKTEAATVRQKRTELEQELGKVKKQLANCRVLVLRSEELLKTLQQRTNDLLARQLLARGPDVVNLLQDNWDQPMVWLTASTNFLKKNSGLNLLPPLYWIILVIVTAISIGIGLLLRHYLCNFVKIRQWQTDFAAQFLRGLITTLAYYAPHLLGSTAAAFMFYFNTQYVPTTPFVSIVSYGLPPYFLCVAIVHLLLAPPQPAELFFTIPVKTAHALARRLQVLLLLTYLGYLLFSTLLSQSLPEPAFLLARSVFAGFLILNLLWAFSLVMKFSRLARLRGLTIGVYFALLAALIIEWMGYRNLSWALLKDVLGSLLAFGVLLLLIRLFRELYSNLESGASNWSKKIRKLLGIREEKHIPGLAWLRFLTGLGLWTLFAWVMLIVWDASETLRLEIYTYLTQGFAVGSLRVVPVKLITALLAIAMILVIGGWLRGQLESNWLKKTYLERGTREALVTITGYIYFSIAFLIGLGVAGFDFSSLAIIAGALSVGIGFGLQNIVNNFISGLILLFERPVKTGDWVVVGNTEGYVKKIRIRYTQIQTFDSADVIVPNSELISNQVTNWMLRDTRGRARIPVGVAYGSDTERVKEILVDVAKKHPKVVIDGSSPEPKVIFREFGDSSLNFELRCHVRNVDERLTIISDLNFAIDKAFRENHIEIPFPQRDLHVRDLPRDVGTNGPEPKPGPKPEPKPGPEDKK